MGRRKTAGWGIGIAAFALCGLCGSITAACDDNDPPPPRRPVVQTSAPITSAPVTVTPTTTKPTPKPTTAAPKATTAKPKPSPTRTTTKPKPKPPSTDTRYGTCREANAHGLGPYYEGEDPEYDWYQDRDGDGVVCER